MTLSAQYFWYYLRKFELGKKIVLFGENHLVKKLEMITEAAGYKVYCLVGEEECTDEKIDSYLNLYYENPDSLFVWIVSYDHMRYVKLLREIGLQEHEHFAAITRPPFMNLDERFILDVHLGYTSDNNERIPGVTVFGDENIENALRIVTLGGSTSDANAYPWKSWSEFLYEKIKAQNPDINVVVYSAGICAYSSSQELIKLQRDMIKLKPDVVISYSGLNDAVLKKDTWTNDYQKMIFDKLTMDGTFTLIGSKANQKYSCGIRGEERSWEMWLNNMKIMNSTCRTFGIKFYGFLQAMMGEESYDLKEDEKELIRNCMDSVFDDTRSFIKNVKEKIGEYDYLYDLTQIFNITEKIYIDTEHVNEFGNRIIANNIYRTIFEAER